MPIHFPGVHASRLAVKRRRLAVAGFCVLLLAGCETVPPAAQEPVKPPALIDADSALAAVPLCTPAQLTEGNLAIDTTGRFNSTVYRTELGLCRPPGATPVNVDREFFANAFAGKIADGSMQVKPQGSGICLVLDGNGFYSGGNKVRPDLDKLLEQVAWITEHVDADMTVVGYTDSVPVSGGRYPDNQALSEARAESAAQALRTHVSDPTRVRFEGRGDSAPVADNATREGRARNRRVEVLIEPRSLTLLQ